MNSGYFYLNGSRIQTNTEIITYQRSNSMDTDETDGDNENYSLISSPNQVYCDISGGDIESQDSYDCVVCFNDVVPFQEQYHCVRCKECRLCKECISTFIKYKRYKCPVCKKSRNWCVRTSDDEVINLNPRNNVTIVVETRDPNQDACVVLFKYICVMVMFFGPFLVLYITNNVE